MACLKGGSCMKYLVLEVHTLYCIVLAEDGSYLKVYNKGYEVGSFISDIEIVKEASEKPRSFKRAIYPILALASVFIITFGIYMFDASRIYGSIYLDINPSVRIDASRNDTVINIDALNDDADDLLEGYVYKGKDIDSVVDELVDIAIAKGYLYAGSDITFTFDSDDDTWKMTHRTNLDDKINYLKEELQVTIIIDDQEDVEYIIPEVDIKPSEESETTPDDTYVDTDYGVDDDVTDHGKDDTDYGPNNDGVTDYDDTDYGPNNDGVTDYSSDIDDGYSSSSNYEPVDSQSNYQNSNYENSSNYDG